MQAALLWLKLWQKQRRASGLPRLQIAVRLGRLGERIGLIDVDFDLSAGNHLEECRGTGKQILPLGRVGHEGRAGDIKRTLGRKRDRKCTRRNSSHVKYSYAVFCLKK